MNAIVALLLTAALAGPVEPVDAPSATEEATEATEATEEAAPEADEEAPQAVEPTSVEPQTPVTAATQPPSEVELRELEATALFKLGLELVINEKWEEACSVLARVATFYEGTEHAGKAAEQARLIGVVNPQSSCATGVAPTPDILNNGQIELVVSQALTIPAFTGILLPYSVARSINGPLIPVGLGLAGMGGAIAGTWILTNKYPVSTGQAMAIYTGEMVGAWNGGALAFAAHPRFFPRSTTLPQYIGGGFLLGTGGGLAAAILLKPDAGQMSLARSGMTWGGFFTGMSLLYLPPPEGLLPPVMARMLVGTDLGLALGGVLASQFDVGRGRMNLINLSGYVGGAVGGGVCLIVGFYSGMRQESTGVVLSVAAAGGIAVGAVLTRKMKASDMDYGASGALVGHGPEGWRIGTPVPAIQPQPDGSYGVQVPLARGTF
ncbi:MAG: hypothetical protein HN348_04620 [Proteobacteria bacterium]|jgi:hypothetical protein|nr:hypothetical protein [Pseudomonadota bacterium]